MTGDVTDRPTPFELVFVEAAERAFPAIQRALAQEERSGRDRDAFLLTREASGLIRELRPEEGAGETIDQLVALVHHAYLYWEAGRRVIRLTPEGARDLFQTSPGEHAGPRSSRYVQFPPRLVWAEVLPGGPHEPLDGLFAHRAADGTVATLAVFGLRPDREGFSVVDARGPSDGTAKRPDGSPAFAPALPGGSEAGLHSLTSPEELLALAARALDVEVDA